MQTFNRDRKIICIVESPKDLLAIERTGSYRGIYYVLLGNISPSEGRGPDVLLRESLQPLQRGHELQERLEFRRACSFRRAATGLLTRRRRISS